MFSQVGLEVLIKAVVQAIHSYSMSCFRLPKKLIKNLHILAANFWWGDNKDNKKLHWSTWDKLCRPKEEKRLGFRSLTEFNQALLAKQGWRLIHNPYSLLARVLKNNYYSNSSFMNASCPSGASYVWKGIIWGRKIITEGARWRVSNGREIRVWEDKWLPRPTGAMITQNPGLRPHTHLHNLMTSEGKWNMDLILNHFHKEDVPWIQGQGLVQYMIQSRKFGKFKLMPGSPNHSSRVLIWVSAFGPTQFLAYAWPGLQGQASVPSSRSSTDSFSRAVASPRSPALRQSIWVSVLSLAFSNPRWSGDLDMGAASVSISNLGPEVLLHVSSSKLSVLARSLVPSGLVNARELIPRLVHERTVPVLKNIDVPAKSWSGSCSVQISFLVLRFEVLGSNPDLGLKSGLGPSLGLGLMGMGLSNRELGLCLEFGYCVQSARLLSPHPVSIPVWVWFGTQSWVGLCLNRSPVLRPAGSGRALGWEVCPAWYKAGSVSQPAQDPAQPISVQLLPPSVGTGLSQPDPSSCFGLGSAQSRVLGLESKSHLGSARSSVPALSVALSFSVPRLEVSVRLDSMSRSWASGPACVSMDPGPVSDSNTHYWVVEALGPNCISSVQLGSRGLVDSCLGLGLCPC
uniref:Uncharacterized protein n=1 Tax=Cannabis sativa TaxID=3483 RepID=A0A803P2R8_CANSA